MRNDAGRETRSRKNSPGSPSIVYHLSPLRVIAAFAAVTLAGCGTMSSREPASVARAPEAATVPVKPSTPRGGGYYLDDGPGDNPPPNLDQIPDAVPKREPLARGAIRADTIQA